MLKIKAYLKNGETSKELKCLSFDAIFNIEIYILYQSNEFILYQSNEFNFRVFANNQSIPVYNYTHIDTVHNYLNINHLFENWDIISFEIKDKLYPNDKEVLKVIREYKIKNILE